MTVKPAKNGWEIDLPVWVQPDEPAGIVHP